MFFNENEVMLSESVHIYVDNIAHCFKSTLCTLFVDYKPISLYIVCLETHCKVSRYNETLSTVQTIMYNYKWRKPVHISTDDDSFSNFFGLAVKLFKNSN